MAKTGEKEQEVSKNTGFRLLGYEEGGVLVETSSWNEVLLHLGRESERRGIDHSKDSPTR